MPVAKESKVEKKSKTQKGGKTTRKVNVTKKATTTKKVAGTTAKKTTTTKKTTQKGGTDTSTTDTTTRYFKIVCEDGNCRGRFSGKKPKQAANKALTSILKQRKDPLKGGKIKFKICECTRGSKCKEYSYVGQRKELTEPMDVTIGDKKITYRFQNVVKKAKKSVKKPVKK